MAANARLTHDDCDLLMPVVTVELTQQRLHVPLHLAVGLLHQETIAKVP